MADPVPLSKLLAERRVLITVGAGGVGKTTTAAALAVAAARSGRRVLCLTIDPAKRLAESLGLGEIGTVGAVVDAAHFAPNSHGRLMSSRRIFRSANRTCELS